jgi:hypothetical protein
MENFLSFLLILLLLAAGFLSIYLVINFFEYLKRFQASVWKDLCFERPFGIPRDDFFFYPVRPLKFMGFLFSPDESRDRQMAEDIKKIKLSLAGIAAAAAFNFIFRLIF